MPPWRITTCTCNFVSAYTGKRPVETSPMSRTDWRSAGAYEDLRSFDAPAFAWEYLRRNANFLRERRKLQRAARRGALDPIEADAFARRWGLRFREQHGNQQRERDSMGAACPAERDCTDAPSGRPRRRSWISASTPYPSALRARQTTPTGLSSVATRRCAYKSTRLAPNRPRFSCRSISSSRFARSPRSVSGAA